MDELLIDAVKVNPLTADTDRSYTTCHGRMCRVRNGSVVTKPRCAKRFTFQDRSHDHIDSVAFASTMRLDNQDTKRRRFFNCGRRRLYCLGNHKVGEFHSRSPVLYRACAALLPIT